MSASPSVKIGRLDSSCRKEEVLDTPATMRSSTLNCILLLSAVAPSTYAFVAPSPIAKPKASAVFYNNDDDGDKQWVVDDKVKKNEVSPIVNVMLTPFVELADIFSNFDDVVDDFFNKRVSTLFISIVIIDWRLSIYFISPQISPPN